MHGCQVCHVGSELLSPVDVAGEHGQLIRVGVSINRVNRLGVLTTPSRPRSTRIPWWSQSFRGVLPRGLMLGDLRQDRIVNEVAESADPHRLMRLLGITATAHPERTAKLPR
ncbi:hypothetical protein GCM10010425_49490 [Streptomyces spororaveus]|uniref:Uncharacterized protein n=1 Tax=Streptomyces spororaveus TaxID=284039 RepID=A0ABQ3T2C9_9ACTN|nr:hypothetical protein [Streptomyces spororaveus]GHI74543.1 hypothetical protein Sspor_01040 [Streptomyces spororaveus]